MVRTGFYFFVKDGKTKALVVFDNVCYEELWDIGLLSMRFWYPSFGNVFFAWNSLIYLTYLVCNKIITRS